MTFVEEIFSTRRLWRWGSISIAKRRRGIRCSRCLITVQTEKLRVSTEVDDWDDEHSAIATRRTSVPERKNRKPWEANDAEARAEELVGMNDFDREVYEERALG